MGGFEMTENWRSVVGYEGKYEVSDQGRVRSVDRLDSRGRRRRGKVMSLRRTTRDHLSISLCADGVSRSFQVHHLVLTAFVGQRPSGSEACHWDDDGANNHLVNLRWDTRSANQLDSVRNGTHHMAGVTECPEGHEYTPANTYRYPGGNRACRECRRIYREVHAEERRQKGREYMRRRRASMKKQANERAA